MAAAKIRTIKELIAAPIKTAPNLDHILIILSELKESKVYKNENSVYYKDENGYHLCVIITRKLYRSLSADTITTLATMGVVVEEVENCFETDYYYRVHAKCDKSGVMEVDTSMLDELEK
jgi:hypothetical protein